MPKFKLQTSAKYKFGVKNLIAYAGEVSFDEQGIIEVDLPEEQVQDLLKDIPDFSIHSIGKEVDGVFVYEPIQPQVEENELGKSEDEKNDIGKDEEDTFTGAADNTAPTTLLDDLNMPDLKALAEGSGFDKAEWENLNKKDLKAYLKGKLN
jgi:hypothetical protein